MFISKEYEQLEALMAECPENRNLIQKLLASHEFTVSKISHEIRNPLTLIYSTLQLIESQHPEVKDFSHWTRMLEDVEFMTHLLNDLSRFNNGQRITSDEFNLYAFMEHLVVSFAVALADTDIEFTSRLDPLLPTIMGDNTKLKEVFLNLLQNARDAVPSNGTISLDAHLNNNMIEVAICDNGCGISSEDLETIFTPFVTHKPEGTGLGLPLAQKIISTHNGRLEVDSTLGCKTTVTVFLPIQKRCCQKSST